MGSVPRWYTFRSHYWYSIPCPSTPGSRRSKTSPCSSISVSNSGPDIRRNGSAGSCRCFASGRPRTRAFPVASDERGISLPSKYAFRARFTHFSLSLTLPSGRKYITRLVKLRDSSVGVGIRSVTEKGNSKHLPLLIHQRHVRVLTMMVNSDIIHLCTS